MNPETISVGVITTIVGMGVVFSVLVLLALLIALLARLTEGKKKAAPAPAPAPAPVAAAPAPAAVAEGKLSAKTVAAIMAAISAATGKPVEQLKFTAIKRVHGTQSSWANAGTSEIINTRQNYL
ncbi:MAG: OadG family transporter subunit [Bacillota bacterium]|nr:OadG family transporter subunit [Bacillota bacterium]